MENKFKLNNIVSLVIVFLVIGGIWYFTNTKSEKVLPESLKSEEYISGVITDVDGGCASDGWCLVEVDNAYWIIYNPGLVMERPLIGKITGPLVIGAKADVYARKSEEKSDSYKNLYTIVGSEKYYIKTVKNPTLYENDELGFSFMSPHGKVYQSQNRTYNDDGSFIDEEFPFISLGESGQSFRSYISNSFDSYAFYFAGMTPNYRAPRDIDCGEINSVAGYDSRALKYGERVNAVGTKYVYSDVAESELEGPHQVAYFKLKKGPFPVLGFCARDGISEQEFQEVIDTVKIY